jgi:hypothetical protein|tara:strand:- start:196 stop:783 length:588 start_codon:yes stop_codon:yes gene_type:complete
MGNKSNYIGVENKGNPVLLAKDPIASAVSSITFDGVFDDSFDEYWISIFNLKVADAGGIRIRWKYRNNGSDITGTYYRNQRSISMNSDNTGQYGNASYTDYNTLTDYTTGTDATRHSHNGIMYIFPRSSNIKYSFFDGMSVADSPDGNAPFNQSLHYAHEFIGVLDDATQMDGISFFTSAGNIASGEVCVYGVKK